MDYYLDSEFLEGTQTKRFFGKTKPTIDLISIALVSDDNREYYAISKDFNLKEAWNRFDEKVEIMSGDMRNLFPKGRKYKEYWIRENVLKPIFDEWKLNNNSKIVKLGLPISLNESKFNYKNFKYCIQCIGKSNKQIAKEICLFIDARYVDKNNPDKGYMYPSGTSIKEVKTTNVKFHAYYADYDWVVFCWLFGKMIDLPKGFPMYCFDLKQLEDVVYEEKKASYYGNSKTEAIKHTGHFINKMSNHPDYPKQKNEHNALDDAKFCKNLHAFLKSVK